MMDTEKLIARAEASLEGVTPGPWRVCQTSIHGQKYGGCWVEGVGIENDDEFLHSPLIPISGSHGAMSYTTRIVEPQRHDDNDANARFIAASRQLVPDLIAAFKASEEALRAERAARERAEAALGLILAQLDNSGLESGSGGPVGERVAQRIEEIALDALKGGAK